MKNLVICCILLVMLIVSGCVVRTYTVERDRVDQEIYGNRGVIMGTPPAVEEKSEARKTREIYNVEIEVPSVYEAQTEKKTGYIKEETKDKDLYGNRGYIQGSLAPEKEVYLPEDEKGQSSTTRISNRLNPARMPQIIYSEPAGNKGIEALSSRSVDEKGYYIVQNGDTLQKISEKFFGTTKEWKNIYDANKHILKSPDRIRPGQKLVIPSK